MSHVATARQLEVLRLIADAVAIGHTTTNGVHDHLRALALAPTTTCPHCGGRLDS